MKMKIIAATAGLLMATSAQATVITFNTSIAVPTTIDGLFINVVTGATSTTEAGAPAGWDLNPWGLTALRFFWPTGTSAGGVASTTTGPYLDLAPGAVISSASILSKSATTAAAAAFEVAGPHILGFSFLNESTGIYNYGYLKITSGATAGTPATVTGWSYEDSGAAITVAGAASAVPEPATWGMMLAGFGMVGFGMRRRSSVKTTVSFA